jgi:hypothetical protein
LFHDVVAFLGTALGAVNPPFLRAGCLTGDTEREEADTLDGEGASEIAASYSSAAAAEG